MNYLLSMGCSSTIAGSGLEMIVQEVSRSSWSPGPLVTGLGSCRPSVDSQSLNSTWSLPFLRQVPGLRVGAHNVTSVHVVAVVVWSWVHAVAVVVGSWVHIVAVVVGFWIHFVAVGVEKGVTAKDYVN